MRPRHADEWHSARRVPRPRAEWQAHARARGVEPRERLGVHGVHGVGVKDQTQSVQAIGPDMFLNGDVLGKVLEIDGSLRLQAVAGVLSTRMLG